VNGYSERLEIAVGAAREAGRYLMAALPEKREISKKGIVDLITEADRKSEQLIHGIIARACPEDSFLAEEGTRTESKSGYTWVVDPLDGTINYAHRFPVFCVSIALVSNGASLIGCIYNPNLDELFTAEKGQGAQLNGQRVHVSVTANLLDCLLATGFPYDVRESEDDNMSNFWTFYKRGAQAVRRAGSAALDLAYVACGRFDGFWEFKLNPWDIAAGTLLVEEAGGTVTDFDGGPLDLHKGEVLASNGIIHDRMQEVLREAKSIRFQQSV